MPNLKKVTVEEVRESINKNITFITNAAHLYTCGLEILAPFKGKPITQRIATAYKTAHPDHYVSLSHASGLWYLYLRLPGQVLNEGIQMFLGYYPTDRTLTEERWAELEQIRQATVLSIKNHERSLMYLETWVEKHNFAVGILADLKKNMEEFGVTAHLPIGQIYFEN